MRLLILSVAFSLLACTPQEAAPPNAAPVPSKEAAGAKSPPSAPAASAAPQSASADPLAASATYHRATPVGRASFPPGTGSVVKVPEADRQAMFGAVKSFLAATQADDPVGMAKVATSLLKKNLIDKLDQYRDRFMQGMTPTLVSMEGGVKPGEVRSPADGHFEIELKFNDGTNRRVMMAVESGQWRVNRL